MGRRMESFGRGEEKMFNKGIKANDGTTYPCHLIGSTTR
jgi:hypothetical protein